MRAMVCRMLGPPEVLRLEEMPSAALGPGQVRVRLMACGVNFPDALMVAGSYQHKPPLPFVPGMEAAGVVTEVAPEVAEFGPGDRVITRHRSGAYADEAMVPSGAVMPLPAGFDFTAGAAFGVAASTAWHALVQRGRLRTGQVLLVHGAGGGVGLAAVEIGRLLGARVIATAGAAERLEAARRRGAEDVIDHRREDVSARVLSLTGGAGADLVYDPVGGQIFETSLRCLAPGGRLLAVGFTGGIPRPDLDRLLEREIAVVGVRAGEHGRRRPVEAAANARALLDLAGRGHLRPEVSKVLPLEHAAEALRLLLDRRIVGRVVLDPNMG